MSWIGDLTIPLEPTHIREQILEARKMFLGSGGSGINWDSLAVWYGNLVQSYLWSECKWKDVLIKQGFTWQSFLKLMKYRTGDVLLWVRGNITWDQLVKTITENLRGPLGEFVRSP